MLDIEFLSLLGNYWPLYLFSLFLSLLSVYPIAKKYTCSWLDPLRLSFVYVCFANAIPVFLYFLGEIYLSDFIYFIFSESFFWLGFVLLARHSVSLSSATLQNEDRIVYPLFLLFLFLFVVFTVYTYLVQGIPLFLDSRLALYQNSGGLGLLGRLNTYFSIFCSISGFYLINKKTCSIGRRILVKLALVIIGITFVLSGSKSGFFTLLAAYYGYCFYYLKNVPSLRKFLFFIVIALVFAVFILFISSYENGGNVLSALVALGYRFIASGDVYWMAYPNSSYEVIDLGDEFYYLFSGLLLPSRVIDSSSVMPAAGLQLNWFISPLTNGIISGPNTRMPILSFLLFGNLGIFFSLFIGAMISFLLFRLPSFFPKGIIGTIFFTYMYIMLIASITDLVLGIGYLFDILIAGILTLFCSSAILLFYLKLRND